MRSIISEFIEYTPHQKEQLWKRAVFVLDTNVFLNLYRYSKETRDALLKAIDLVSDRIWLPYHVAYEFMNRRTSVIFESEAIYKELLSDTATFIKKIKESLNLEPDSQRISQLQAYVEDWINRQKRENLLVSSPSDDSLLEKLLTIFDGKTGENYSEAELDKLKKDGDKRLISECPPGYIDYKIKKKSGKVDSNAYGDFIIWQQILDYSKENEKDIIFITHDRKDDWWNNIHGRTIGPRIELRREFHKTTGHQFHMYTMKGFIEQSNKINNVPQNKDILYEISHIENTPPGEFNILMNKYLRDSIAQILEIRDNNKQNHHNKEIASIQRKINSRQNELDRIEAKYRNKPMPEEVYTQVMNIRKNLKKNHEALHRFYIDNE